MLRSISLTGIASLASIRSATSPTRGEVTEFAASSATHHRNESDGARNMPARHRYRDLTCAVDQDFGASVDTRFSVFFSRP
jgi:hypothetical protein